MGAPDERKGAARLPGRAHMRGNREEMCYIQREPESGRVAVVGQ